MKYTKNTKEYVIVFIGGGEPFEKIHDRLVLKFQKFKNLKCRLHDNIDIVIK